MHRIHFLYFHGYLMHGGNPSEGVASERVVHHVNGIGHDNNRWNLADVTRPFNNSYIPHKHYPVYNSKTKTYSLVELNKAGRRKHSVESIARMKESQNKTEVIKAKRKTTTARWKDPDFRSKMEEIMNSDDWKIKQRESHKVLWEDPEYRNNRIESQKTLWKNLEYHESQSKSIKQGKQKKKLRNMINSEQQLLFPIDPDLFDDH